MVTFRSQDDRNDYVVQPIVRDVHYYEPVHQHFKECMGPLLASRDVVVLDCTVAQRAE